MTTTTTSAVTAECHLRRERNSIFGAALWMAFVTALLCWLPVIGPLVGGFVGGRHAGGVMRGILAVFTLVFGVGIIVYFFAAAITSLPIVGAIAGLSLTTIMLIGAGPLLLGSILGGLLSK